MNDHRKTYEKDQHMTVEKYTVAARILTLPWIIETSSLHANAWGSKAVQKMFISCCTKIKGGKKKNTKIKKAQTAIGVK